MTKIKQEDEAIVIFGTFLIKCYFLIVMTFKIPTKNYVLKMH